MRHQVNHFVSTLQQYVESQLSHVSWCRFLYSLKLKVTAIKQTFDKNMKELHSCYLKSPKHGEFGLPQFWEYLYYNKYYSDAASVVHSSVTRAITDKSGSHSTLLQCRCLVSYKVSRVGFDWKMTHVSKEYMDSLYAVSIPLQLDYVPFITS
ncbi:hypothetical protein ACLB2K_026347 [Fragaria x ananassa]